ncbi:MAG: glycosyltransferase [Gammaproteobacteria bacterium]|nr:glycosyltransferase [Gammaproteobacteria bacterium]NIR81914.1 glycosyltransferase [Gammaproteobacteria bacterium]NIR88746.1 glycosyltransferase [Gammaproteobacteria bacterium]NIU03022.1 glycosyltransferase [Gammaproteobacteria bacterium]NIV50543.1 glycosyltransferase [Gammaproteobacteria bacterium]
MRVVASPAFKGRAANPYTWSLYDRLGRLGVEVTEFTRRRILAGSGADIWHVHWPEGVLVPPNPLKAFVKLQTLLFLLRWARLKGVRVVWTVHNLGSHPHERRHRWLEAWFWRAFIPKVDAYISLTETGRELATRRFPALAQVPGFVIPHGHYRGLYPDEVSRADARARLDLPSKARVALFIGQIRPYKNVPGLIEAFAQLPDEDARLIIAGRVRTRRLREILEEKIFGDLRIRAHLDFVPAAEMQLYLRAADLVVLPYDEVLNSGSALLALSFDRPVLAPAKGALRELAGTVGSEWVRLFEGELRAECLGEALRSTGTPAHRRPNLQPYEWPRIAEATACAYAEVLDAHDAYLGQSS